MNNNISVSYSINLAFEQVSLPPFEDILVIGNGSEQGVKGLSKTFSYLAPDAFEAHTVAHENVEAVFINRNILKKIALEKILNILENRVFPFVSANEIIKVDFSVKVNYETIIID